MPTTNSEPQPSFDPRYEWQGDHSQWQGDSVRGIEANINPRHKVTFAARVYEQHELVTDPVRRWGNAFAIFSLLVPGLSLALVALASLVSSIAGNPTGSEFTLIMGAVGVAMVGSPLCGLGGLVFIGLGIVRKSRRVGWQGVLELSVFVAFGFLAAPIMMRDSDPARSYHKP